jgi:Mn-dependent DtxR family transcriptional regulator
MVKLTTAEQKVFDSISKSPKRPTDISNDLKIALPDISRRLSTLRRLGLVDYKEDGNQRIYSVLGV